MREFSITIAINDSKTEQLCKRVYNWQNIIIKKFTNVMKKKNSPTLKEQNNSIYKTTSFF